MKLPTIRLSIQSRLLLAILAPILLMTVLMAVYTIQARHNDLETQLKIRIENIRVYITSTADIALYSGNLEALNNIAEDLFRYSENTAIAYQDKQGNLLTASQHFKLPAVSLSDISPDVPYIEGELYYRTPILLSGIDFDDYQEERESAEEELVGWATFTLDLTDFNQERQEIYLSAIAIAIIGFLTAIFATFLVSQTITSPIRQLTRTVRTLEEGNLEAVASVDSNDELAILANGINRLTATIVEGRDNLEQRVKMATEQLHQTLEHLQQKNQEIEEARQQSEMANQAKSEFLARMSHELRTPITSIQGFARLLNSSSTDLDDRQYCTVIDQAAEQLLTLINDILDFSKLQSNTVSIARKPFDLADCVEQVVSLFSQTAQEKGLELILDIDPDLNLARIGDKNRIRQIVNNLLSNAIKFTSKGGVYVFVQRSPTNPFSVVLVVRDTGIGIKQSNRESLFQAFSQADTSISRQYGGTGLGLSIVKNLVDLMEGAIDIKSVWGAGTEFSVTLPVSEDLSEHQWTAHKLHALVGHSNSYAYTAVSHALARYAVTTEELQADMGNIDGADLVIFYLGSDCQQREEFPEQIIRARQLTDCGFIVLPPVTNLHNLFSEQELRKIQPAVFIPNPPSLASLNKAITNAKKPAAATTESTQRKPLQGLNVLIAEDNQFTSLLLETLMDKAGAQFITVTNGNEAIKITEKEPFDILLIDVHMPEKNGVDTIMEIRNGNTLNQATPIIALTADILLQEERALNDIPTCQLLLKPFDESYLLERIRHAVGFSLSTPSTNISCRESIPENLYIEELTRLLGEARTALDAGNITEAREQTHQMIGIAGVFNFDSLEDRIITLHQTIKSENTDDIEKAVAGMKDALLAFGDSN